MKMVMNGMEWVAKMAYLNILWLLFSLVGLVLFGFFPATMAMFAIIRQWLLGNIYEWNIKLFLKIYRQEFWKSNLIGAVFLVIIFLSYVNFQYIAYYESAIHQLIKIPLLVVMMLIVVAILYVMPVYVHYDISLKEVFKYAVYLMLLHPLANLGMIISLAVVLLSFALLPNTAIFFLGSVTAYIIMRTCLHIFTNLSEKQAILQLQGKTITDKY